MNLVCIAAALGLSAFSIQAQVASQPSGEFDVASVKRSPPGQPGAIYHTPGGRFKATGLTLLSLISFAYDVSDDRVVGLPPWGSRDHFDVEAVGDGPVEKSPSKMETPEKKAMVRKLLAERFGLDASLEDRDVKTYSLSVAPGGSKLTPNTEKPYLIQAGRRSYIFQRATMTALAHQLSAGVRRDIGREVVDKTGLKGEFDFNLKWSSPNPAMSATEVNPLSSAASVLDQPPLIFEAIQRQLGLELKSDHQDLQFVVIKNVQEPSAN